MGLRRAVYPMLRTYTKRPKASGRYIIRAPTYFNGQGNVSHKEQRRSDKEWCEKCVQPLQYLNRKRHWLVRRGPADRWGIDAYFSVA